MNVTTERHTRSHHHSMEGTGLGSSTCNYLIPSSIHAVTTHIPQIPPFPQVPRPTRPLYHHCYSPDHALPCPERINYRRQKRPPYPVSSELYHARLRHVSADYATPTPEYHEREKKKMTKQVTMGIAGEGHAWQDRNLSFMHRKMREWKERASNADAKWRTPSKVNKRTLGKGGSSESEGKRQLSGGRHWISWWKQEESWQS